MITQRVLQFFASLYLLGIFFFSLIGEIDSMVVEQTLWFSGSALHCFQLITIPQPFTETTAEDQVEEHVNHYRCARRLSLLFQWASFSIMLVLINMWSTTINVIYAFIWAIQFAAVSSYIRYCNRTWINYYQVFTSI